MGHVTPDTVKLFRQLSWVVQQLSLGYYGWRAGILTEITFTDGTVMQLDPTLNAGTVALQYLFAKWDTPITWAGDLYGAESMPLLMEELFGNFWLRAGKIEPLYAPELKQPEMILPFGSGHTWSYVGGPHSAWGTDGALSALDFAPPVSVAGNCEVSLDWIISSTPGVVARSANGVVVVDINGDGIEQTGWAILYLHVADEDRATVGTVLKTGDRIGHPSCVGGVALGTHVHIARKYNGEWILADGPVPFVLSGYVAHNGSRPYLGTLIKDDLVINASETGNLDSNITP
jgi:hypothetical protein